MLALLPSCAIALQSVVGLTADEHFSLRASRQDEFDVPSASGRLLHAQTAAPIAGAQIEVWVEDWRQPQEPIARGTSLADGSFRIAHPENDQADKLLIRAAGFRNTTVAASDAQDLLLWPAAAHLALRVVDLEGRPIAGALAQTRQTCAHAPPAFRKMSDTDGRFDLSQFPPLEDEPEIVVTAPGFGALLLPEPERMLAAGGLEGRLPRRGVVAFELVDTSGAPLANRRVSLGAEPHWLAGATDEAGRARFDSVFFQREMNVQVEHDGEASFVSLGRAPSSIEPRLVFAPAVPVSAGAASENALHVKLVDPAGRSLDLPIVLLHHSGSDLESKGILRADWGPTTVIAGGAFSGWNEAVRVLETPAETTLQLSAEPSLAILLPEGGWDVHIQSGDDSISLWFSPDHSERPTRCFVPAGGPLLVCAVGETQTRLARLRRIDADATIDLTSANCVVATQPVASPLQHVRFAIPGAESFGHVRTPQGWIDPSGLPHEFNFKLEAGAAFEGWLCAPGCVARALGPRGEPPGQDGVLLPELPRRGALIVRGAVRAVHAGGAEAEFQSDMSFVVEYLAPGPLLAQVQLADGRVLDLDLTLRDGERRELRIEGVR